MANENPLRGEERRVISTKLYRTEFANFVRICKKEDKSVNRKLREMVNEEVKNNFGDALEERDIQEVKGILREIYRKGFEIVDNWKKKYDDPKNSLKRSVSEIMIDSDLFYLSLFDNFWKLFKMVSEDLDNALVQPWIRTIIEQASDIFDYHSKKDNEKKKELACKYWLCALGFIGGKQGNLEYDDFLNFIGNRKDKVKFLRLKEEGYPPKKFHIEWNNLFAKINEKEIPELMEKYFLNMNGNQINKSEIDRFYKDMSLYHHPNILITSKIEKELKDKSHLFRCFALISFIGVGLIKFSTEEIMKTPEPKFIEELNKKINILFKKLYFGKRSITKNE